MFLFDISKWTKTLWSMWTHAAHEKFPWLQHLQRTKQFTQLSSNVISCSQISINQFKFASNSPRTGQNNFKTSTIKLFISLVNRTQIRSVYNWFISSRCLFTRPFTIYYYRSFLGGKACIMPVPNWSNKVCTCWQLWIGCHVL